MDHTHLNPKTGKLFCENGSRYAATARDNKVLAAHLKQKLPNYCVGSSYLAFSSSSRRLGQDEYRVNSDKRILNLPEVFFPPSHVENKPSEEVYEFAVKNPEVHLNKLRVLDMSAKGNHSYDYGLVDLGYRHHNHEEKEF